MRQRFDFACQCGHQFSVFTGRHLCKCGKVYFVGVTQEQWTKAKDGRIQRARSASQRRDWVRRAILSRVRDGEGLGDAIARLAIESNGPRLRAYLEAWVSECGCDRAYAIESLNTQNATSQQESQQIIDPANNS